MLLMEVIRQIPGQPTSLLGYYEQHRSLRLQRQFRRSPVKTKPEELISDHFRALKDASNTAFPLASTAEVSEKSPQRWCSAPIRAADDFDRLYHGVVKPVFGEGFITLGFYLNLSCGRDERFSSAA